MSDRYGQVPSTVFMTCRSLACIPYYHYGSPCTACTQGDIRLVAGSAANEGRVEICNNNMWGSVCDQGWDINDARVACRHAGYSGEATSECSIVTIYVIHVII